MSFFPNNCPISATRGRHSTEQLAGTAASSLFRRLIPTSTERFNGGEVLLRHVHRRTSVRRRRHHPPLGPSVLVCRLSNFPWRAGANRSCRKIHAFHPVRCLRDLCLPHSALHRFCGLSCCCNSGKTSLLFQFAINRAAESGRHVVFICSKGRWENSPPFLSQVRSLACQFS